MNPDIKKLYICMLSGSISQKHIEQTANAINYSFKPAGRIMTVGSVNLKARERCKKTLSEYLNRYVYPNYYKKEQ